MPLSSNPTFGEMRAAGVRRIVVACTDDCCKHWSTISGDRWGDRVRLSDAAASLICYACGRRGGAPGRSARPANCRLTPGSISCRSKVRPAAKVWASGATPTSIPIPLEFGC